MASSEHALAAAVAVAREHGLRVGDPFVIRDSVNLLVRLAPAPVLGRVALTFQAARGVDALERELAVATWAAEHGAQVATPSDELPPGPHLRDGYWITFWRYAEHADNRTLDIEAGVRSLRTLHEAIAEFPGVLPTYHLDEVEVLLAETEPGDGVRADDLELLRAAVRRVRTEVESLPRRALHGDAHLGNALATSTGPLWTDFENVCAGVVEYDLAAAVVRQRVHAFDFDLRRAVDLAPYGEYDEELLERVLPAYMLFATAWMIPVARRMPESPPQRILAERLAWWRAYAREM
jgi:thiamine kinase-like enzyme